MPLFTRFYTKFLSSYISIYIYIYIHASTSIHRPYFFYTYIYSSKPTAFERERTHTHTQTHRGREKHNTRNRSSSISHHGNPFIGNRRENHPSSQSPPSSIPPSLEADEFHESNQTTIISGVAGPRFGGGGLGRPRGTQHGGRRRKRFHPGSRRFR